MTESTQIAVGKRISQERKALGVSQKELAEWIGITKSRLAHYEEGRGCLRCGIALKICQHLIISEKWLATGEGEKDQCAGVGSLLPEKHESKSFAENYHAIIEPIYVEIMGKTEGDIRFLPLTDIQPESFRLALIKISDFYADKIQDEYTLKQYLWEIVDYVNSKGSHYAKPPSDRYFYEAACIRVKRDDGSLVPFSYKRFYDDLDVIGVGWNRIESLFNELRFKHGDILEIGLLRRYVHSRLEDADKESMNKTKFARLYKKLHMRES